MRAFLLAVALLATSQVMAGNCGNKTIDGLDMCEIAKLIVEHTAPQLPQQLSREVSMTGIFYNEASVEMSALIHTNAKDLKALYTNAETSLADYKNAIQTRAELMCDPDEGGIWKMFVDAGGIVTYSYWFLDGEHFASFTIDNCDN